MTHDEALRVLESLPDDLRERTLARLKEEGEKHRVLKSLIQEGLDDASAGRVTDWDVAELLAEMDEDESVQKPADQ